MKTINILMFGILMFFSTKAFTRTSEWVVFTNNDLGISKTNIITIAQDNEGIIWVGTQSGAILKYDGDSWGKYDSSNTPIPPGFIWTTVVDSLNNKWFGTYGNIGGLIKYDNVKWTVYNVSEFGIEGSSILSIAIDNSNNLWMGTYWDGLVMFDTDTTWMIFNSTNSGLLQPQEEINCVAIDDMGILWYGSDGWSGGKFDMNSNWTYLDNVDEVVLSIGFDEKKNTWVGGWSYVTKIDSENQTIHYKYREGGVRYFNLIADTNSMVWFTSAVDGFLKLDYSNNETWTKLFPKGYDLDSIGCQGLMRDNYGNFWIGYNNGNIAVYNKNGIVGITDVDEHNNNIPGTYSISQNYPNPFNPSTTISYQIPKDGFVNLVVYNTLGQVVAKLVNEHQISGKYSVKFNANNLPSGVYFYKIVADSYGESGGFNKVSKMILLR